MKKTKKIHVKQFVFRCFNSRACNFTEKWTSSQMILKNTYLKRHLLMAASKWRWFSDFQALWEIVEICHYKCSAKYQKHLKTSAEFAENAYGGLHFSSKLKAKTQWASLVQGRQQDVFITSVRPCIILYVHWTSFFNQLQPCWCKTYLDVQWTSKGYIKWSIKFFTCGFIVQITTIKDWIWRYQ